MSAESYLAQLRRWPPGRRATFRDPDRLQAEGKIPQGTTGGLLLYPIPLPVLDKAPSGDGIPSLRFGQAVEIEKPDGFDVVVLEEDELELEPFDAARLRNDLWHRTVDFDMPRLLGLPDGARADGLIEDVVFRGGAPTDYAVGVKVEVDGNSRVNVHHLTADFSQCRLRLRTR